MSCVIPMSVQSVCQLLEQTVWYLQYINTSHKDQKWCSQSLPNFEPGEIDMHVIDIHPPCKSTCNTRCSVLEQLQFAFVLLCGNWPHNWTVVQERQNTSACWAFLIDWDIKKAEQCLIKDRPLPILVTIESTCFDHDSLLSRVTPSSSVSSTYYCCCQYYYCLYFLKYKNRLHLNIPVSSTINTLRYVFQPRGDVVVFTGRSDWEEGVHPETQLPTDDNRVCIPNGTLFPIGPGQK